MRIVTQSLSHSTSKISVLEELSVCRIEVRGLRTSGVCHMPSITHLHFHISADPSKANQRANHSAIQPLNYALTKGELKKSGFEGLMIRGRRDEVLKC